MPWLVGTALIHSLAVTEKRGTFRSWTVLLAIVAFATDPARGIFILIFLSIVIGGSFTLYAMRAGAVGGGAGFAPVSRESLLLANNVLLIVAMASVLLGTLYPLFLDALDLGKISVGPPYFEAVFVPLMTPLVFLMGIGPIAAWRDAPLPGLWTRLKWALGVAVATAIVVPFVLGGFKPMVALGLGCAAWIVAATASTFAQRLIGAPQRTWIDKLTANPPAWYGMLLAHLGVAVFIVGVTLVKGYEIERDVRLDVGQGIDVGGYTFTFRGVAPQEGPNYRAIVGTVDVARDGKPLPALNPEKRIYAASGQTMTEAAIDTGVFGDRYVSLGEPVTEDAIGGAWGVRIYVKPFIDWIWFGCLLMALGGGLAVADRRYRLATREKTAVLPSPLRGEGSGAA